MGTDFIPDPDPEFDNYNQEFAAELNDTGTAVGFTSTEVTQFKSDADGFTAQLIDVGVKLADYQAAVAAKNTNRAAREVTLRAYAKRIKDNGAYTEAIGRDYKIIRPASAFDPATYKTVLKIRLITGQPDLRWLKGGAHGVRIYWRLVGSSTWIFLDRDTKSPYRDTRPVATPGVSEHREYMARGFFNDVEIGVDSDIVSIVVPG
jgi:hypothetical protein